MKKIWIIILFTVIGLGVFVCILNNTKKYLLDNKNYNEGVMGSYRNGDMNVYAFYKRDYDGKTKLLFNPKIESIEKAGFDFYDINKDSIVVCENKKRIFFYSSNTEVTHSREESDDVLATRYDYHMMDFDSNIVKLTSTYQPASILLSPDCKHVMVTIAAQIAWFGIYDVDRITGDKSYDLLDDTKHMLTRDPLVGQKISHHRFGAEIDLLYPVKWSNKKPKAFFSSGEVYKEGRPNTEGLWLVEFEESDAGGYSEKQTLILAPGEVFYGIDNNDRPVIEWLSSNDIKSWFWQ